MGPRAVEPPSPARKFPEELNRAYDNFRSFISASRYQTGHWKKMRSSPLQKYTTIQMMMYREGVQG